MKNSSNGTFFRRGSRSAKEMEYLWNLAHDLSQPTYHREHAVEELEDEYLFRKKFKTIFFSVFWGGAAAMLLFSVISAMLVNHLIIAIILTPVVFVFFLLAGLAEILKRKQLNKAIEESFLFWSEAKNFLTQTTQK